MMTLLHQLPKLPTAMPPWRWRVHLFVGMFLCISVPLHAQSQSDKADLAGVVTDQTGAFLPSASITVTNTATGLRRTAETDQRGVYRVLAIPAGEYQVRVERAGFTTQIHEGVTVTVGQYATLDVTLDIASLRETVVVVSSPRIIEKEKAVQASTIQRIEIEHLPINGRNFLNFALLTPGVTPDNPMLAAITLSNTPTSGLSFAGQDQRSNYVTIDGMDNMDVAVNSVRPTLNQDAVQEFQIISNSFSAEFGRARAGIINIVSKSGTNDFRGDSFIYFRDDSMDARNAFAFGANRRPIDPPFRRSEWGGSVGGPIVRDRTFFFGSYEGLHRKESVFVSVLEDPAIFRLTQSQQSLFDFLQSTGDPLMQRMAQVFANPATGILNTTPQTFPETISLLESNSGVFPFKGASSTVSFRLDHRVSDRIQAFARVNFHDGENDGTGFGGLRGVSNGNRTALRNYSLVAGGTHIFSPTTLSDVRVQFGRFEFQTIPNDLRGPEIEISGVARVGRDRANPTSQRWNVFQVVDSLMAVRSSHTLKAGVDLAVMNSAGFAETFLGGQFLFGEAIPLAAVLDRAFGAGATGNLINRMTVPTSGGGLGRPDLVPNLLAPISALQSYNLGLPLVYVQGFGDPHTKLNYVQLGTYAQDTWRVNNNVVLNLGVRYDADWQADTVTLASRVPPFQLTRATPRDWKNLAPRVGFTFDPSGSGKTLMRGGYGLSHQNAIQLANYVSRIWSGQISQIVLPLRGPGLRATSADVWAFYRATGRLGRDALEAFGMTPGTTPAVLLVLDKNTVNPYSHQASVGIERELAANGAVALDYVLNRGRHMLRTRDVNLTRVGPNQFASSGLDPRYLHVNVFESSGSSIYHGLSATFRKRWRGSHKFSASYTLGKAVDDGTDFITFDTAPQDHTDLPAERALSSFDQRHRFVANGVWQRPLRSSSDQGFASKLAAGWTLAGVVTWASGRPFNVLRGFDANGDGHSSTDRALLADGTTVGRNTGIGASFFATDMRLSRAFPVTQRATIGLVFEAFNLFNNANYSGVNNVTGSMVLEDGRVRGNRNVPPNQPLGFTSAFPARQLQLGLRVNF